MTETNKINNSSNNIKMSNDNKAECNQHGSNCDGACKDPNVDNGMMTKVWGPAGWLFLHCVTFGYPYAINPENEQHTPKPEEYYNFFYYLGKVMPCRYCRESYQEFFKELDLSKSLNSRNDLSKWLYDIHNKVNHKLGIPECQIPTFDELVQQYESYRAKCKPTTDEERQENQKKGCITPADGTPRRSVLKVVQYKKGDVTRRDNALDSVAGADETSDDYMVMKKSYVLVAGILLALFIGLLVYFARDRICAKSFGLTNKYFKK